MAVLRIKAGLTSSDELRRINLDRDNLTFARLLAALALLFPGALPGASVCYRDDDGDAITIRSDPELEAALPDAAATLALDVVPDAAPRRKVRKTEAGPAGRREEAPARFRGLRLGNEGAREEGPKIKGEMTGAAKTEESASAGPVIEKRFGREEMYIDRYPSNRRGFYRREQA